MRTFQRGVAGGDSGCVDGVGVTQLRAQSVSIHCNWPRAFLRGLLFRALLDIGALGRGAAGERPAMSAVSRNLTCTLGRRGRGLTRFGRSSLGICAVHIAAPPCSFLRRAFLF